MREQYVNAATTTLAAAITTLSQSSITVADATAFPPNPQFRVIINGEILLVTAVSGVTWTVSRGVEGTQPTTCSAGTIVDHILTSAALQELRLDTFMIGPYADLPSTGASVTGDLFVPTDSFYDIIRFNGTSWDHMRTGKLMTPPDNSLYNWDNQGTATVTTTFGGIIGFSTPAPAGSITVRHKIVPSTPYTLTVAFLAQYPQTNFAQVGVCWRESSSGKLAACGVAYSNQWVMRFPKFNTSTSYNSDYTTIPIPPTVVHGSVIWMQLVDDNTTRSCRVSANGTTWTTVHSIGRTDFLTPNQIGFYWGNCDVDMGITILHWKES